MSVERTVKIWAGTTMPRIGLGTWTMWEKHGDKKEVETAVKLAIDEGYRHFDTAYLYQNEGAVGAAINAKIADGTIKREDVFVTSKLFCTNMRPERVIPQVKTSLAAFGLEYLDMFLIHWPIAYTRGEKETDDELFARLFKDAHGKPQLDFEADYVVTWKALEDAVDCGLVKAIGLSNFNHKQIDRVFEAARIKPSCLQIEVSPHCANTKLIDYCQRKYPNMAIVAYSPFGCPSRFWIEPNDPPSLLDNEKLGKIAKQTGKTVAQVIIRWLLQRGLVVIPKSVTPSRIKENIQVFDFELSHADMSSIESLDCRFRAYSYLNQHDIGHPNWPFREEF